MNSKKKYILITLPSLQDQGGVASFYNAILPSLSGGEYAVSTLQIGSTSGHGNRLYPITDQLRFRRTITNHRSSLVHINPSLDIKSFFRDGLFVYQAKRKRLPVIVFFHGWQKDFEQVVSKKLLWFFRRSFGKADAFIVLATEFKEVLQRWGIAQPIHLETTTVDESLLANFSISNKLTQVKDAHEIKILFLARLEREKGVFETVDAVSSLIQKGLPVSLSIAGDGNIMDELQQYVEKRRIPKKSIRFLGYVKNSDKITAFTDHHIYCFPTYGEGLPTSVLEAMAFGIPIITRPVGGLADFFQDGRMGFLCQGKTPAEIASALEKVISDKSLLLKMGKYNHIYAKEHFMASAVAKKLTDIYQATLSATNY